MHSYSSIHSGFIIHSEECYTLKESATVLRNNNQKAAVAAKVFKGGVQKPQRQDVAADIRRQWGKPSHSKSRNWRWGVALAGIA